MGLEVERGPARLDPTARLAALLVTCRATLHMVAGLELPVLSILSALASAPRGEAVWTLQGAGRAAGVSPSIVLRVVELADSVDLLSMRRVGTDAIAVALREQGWAVVRRLEIALH